MAQRIVLALVILLVAGCESGGGAATASPSPNPTAIRASGWPSGETIAVYDGPSDGLTRMTFVVGVKAQTATVLAKAIHAARTPVPGPSCGIADCGGPIDPQYVSTSNDNVYVLDGDKEVKVLGVDGSLSKVTSIEGGAKAHAAFAVSPDDSMIAVGVIDFSPGGGSKVYVERIRGGGRVELSAPANAVYWPVGWRDGSIVLAYGLAYGAYDATSKNPYSASGYALVEPVAGAQPHRLGTGDCVPSGTIVHAGTACIKAPGMPCLENEVANPESTAYYNTCLRRIDWSGVETNFLVPYNSYSRSFTVAYAALSLDGQQILTDQLGTLFAPVSASHGGNDFLGSYSVPVPAMPSMGWLDDQHYSFGYAYPDGVTRDRISGATFEGQSDVAPGVSGSPVTGQLVTLLPAGL